MERKTIRPALAESFEALFHQVKKPNFLLLPHASPSLTMMLNRSRLERAIGVIYLPERERESHYFYAQLAEQFDAVIHIDTTHALEPLDKTSVWQEGELPETYPFGL